MQASRSYREQHWRLLPGGLDRARGDLDRISKQWDAALERLRNFVEE